MAGNNRSCRSSNPTPWERKAMPAVLVVLFSVVCAMFAAPPGAVAFDPQQAARATAAAPPLVAHAKEGLPQLDTPLNQLLGGWKTNRAQAQLEATAQGVKIEQERVHVTLLMLDEAAADDALAALPDLGGEVTAQYKWAIDAWVPVPRLEDLAKLPRVSLIHRPIPPMPLEDPPILPENLPGVGSYVTQGVWASNADDWQLAGYLGLGIGVAVIDSFQGYASAQIAGELPATMYCYPTCGSLDLSSPHGTACAEIVYDMAPGAVITMASTTTETDMASKIVALASSGHKVITASLGFPSAAPGDGTGVMASAIAEARDNYGAFYVNSAGNHARYHWDGYFSDTTGDGAHDFPGGNFVNELNYPGQLTIGTTVIAYLRWSAWPTTNQDFDLYLFWWSGSQWLWVARSINMQTGTQPPWEFLSYTVPSTGYYGLAVIKYSATTNPVIDLMAWSRQPLEQQEPNRSLTEPSTAPKSFSVAAVDVTTYNLESYSSRGPAHGAGGTLSGGVAQPRIAGYANVDTWSYGAGGFNGTSSAAPHVAGGAALVRGAYPGYTPAQVASFLEGRAIDLGAAGYDYSYGAGRLYLGCPTPLIPTISAPSSASSGAQYTVSWNAMSADNAYELQEATDASFTSPTTYSVSGISRNFTHTVGVTTTYYYRVRSADYCNSAWYYSPWSGTGQTMVTVYYTLSVSKSGGGTGTVTSSPAGVSCGGDCSESYSGGTVVTLTATPDGGSAFAGWSGACSGSSSCQVTMSAARSVTAWFSSTTGCATTVTGQAFTSAQLYQSCYSIVAGPNVSTTTAAGHLTLRAANQVILRNGFSVGTGARLTVALDPTLAGT